MLNEENTKLKDLLTIEQARILCSISFAHAWWMVKTGRWTPVRVGPSSRVIRVRLIEVEATKAAWDTEDLAKKNAYREELKARKEAKKANRSVKPAA